VAALVLVEVGLGADDLEDALGGGAALLDRREGEDRDEGWEAQDVHQAHGSDHVADADGALAVEDGGVQEGAAHREAVEQQRQVARLDAALLHV
jgi:hypothetical protein